MVSGEENRRKKRGRGRTNEIESDFLEATGSRQHKSNRPHPRPSSRREVAALPRQPWLLGVGFTERLSKCQGTLRGWWK